MVSATDPGPAPSSEQHSATSQEYSESGVDLSLIRWMLSLSPMERLLVIQQQVNAVQELKEEIDSD
jgi:hypothetical protein